jgi:hypothetical protein
MEFNGQKLWETQNLLPARACWFDSGQGHQRYYHLEACVSAAGRPTLDAFIPGYDFRGGTQYETEKERT